MAEPRSLSPAFRTIVADPPWEYRGTSGINRGRNAGKRAPMLAYPTMTILEISDLPVAMFARRDRLGWDTWGNESLGTAEIAA